jgi:hypothetical protein
MKTDHTELALDTEGIPILTDLITEDGTGNRAVNVVAKPHPTQTPQDISRELLASEPIQQQLNQMARNLAQNVRLQVEQNLAQAIDDAIKQTLDNSSTDTYETVRKQLDSTVQELVTKALQDSELAS